MRWEKLRRLVMREEVGGERIGEKREREEKIGRRNRMKSRKGKKGEAVKRRRRRKGQGNLGKHRSNRR